MASACNHGSGTSYAGYVDPGGAAQNYAGTTSNVAKVWSATTIRIAGDGSVNNVSNFIPTATNGASSGAAVDPFEGKVQPPVLASGSTGTCVITARSTGFNGITGGTAASPVTFGPYQYYVKVVNNSGNLVSWGD